MDNLFFGSPKSYDIVRLFKWVVLTLTLTSLVFCGIELTAHSPAAYAEGSTLLTQNPQVRYIKLPKALANAILRDASKRSHVPIRELEITQVTQKTFGNRCRFNFGEICTEEYNPIYGWEVLVQVREQFWTYHVDKSGSQIVLDPKNRKDS
jgi:hypothetical protein